MNVTVYSKTVKQCRTLFSITIKICYSLATEDPPAAGKNINLSLGNVQQVFCH